MPGSKCDALSTARAALQQHILPRHHRRDKLMLSVRRLLYIRKRSFETNHYGHREAEASERGFQWTSDVGGAVIACSQSSRIGLQSLNCTVRGAAMKASDTSRPTTASRGTRGDAGRHEREREKCHALRHVSMCCEGHFAVYLRFVAISSWCVLH